MPVKAPESHNPMAQPLPKGSPHDATTKPAGEIVDRIQEKSQDPQRRREPQPQPLAATPEARGMKQGMERTPTSSSRIWVILFGVLLAFFALVLLGTWMGWY